jgi:hypothetical protein
MQIDAIIARRHYRQTPLSPDAIIARRHYRQTPLSPDAIIASCACSKPAPTSGETEAQVQETIALRS